MAELSEFTTMGCLHFTNTELKNYETRLSNEDDAGAVLDEMVDRILQLVKDNKIDWGTSTKEKNNQVRKLSPPAKGKTESNDKRKKRLQEVVWGISAAKAIRVWLQQEYGVSPTDSVLKGTASKKGYMTGATWSQEILKFKLDSFGMTDYNSSDIIIKLSKTDFYGISLKKKGTASSAQDPTVLNKAFDTLLNEDSDDIKKLKKEIDKERARYFAGVLRKAHELGHIQVEPESLVTASVNYENDKKLWKAKPPEQKAKNKQHLVAKKDGRMIPYINLKGSLIPKSKNTDHVGYAKNDDFRDFVNRELGTNQKASDHIFTKLKKIMMHQDVIDIFAHNLVGLILKTDLLSGVQRRFVEEEIENEGYTFGFALCTSVGALSVKKDGKHKVTVGTATCFEQASIICALSHLLKEHKTKNYTLKDLVGRGGIAVQKGKKGDAVAAKTWFGINIGTFPIIDMELRFKGTFTAQPQFFGYLTQNIKDVITGVCKKSAQRAKILNESEFGGAWERYSAGDATT